MLNSLYNPKTEDYQKFKDWVLGPDFFWTYNAQGGVKFPGGYSDKSVPFYTRTFLRRPELKKYPSLAHASLEETEYVIKIVTEILEHNKCDIHSILRLSVNATHPQKKIISSFPHYDHQFPHKNLIIYLTDSGGSTFVDGVEHDPKEDDIIFFTGEHYMHTPAENRRIILVVTML